MNRALRDILAGVLAAALIVGIALSARYLNARGLFPGDVKEFIGRSCAVIAGLYTAYLANSVPKALIPLGRMGEPAFAQSLRRFIAAVLFIGALLFTAAWLFAPFKLALPLSLASLGSAFVLTVIAVLVCGISQGKAKAKG